MLRAGLASFALAMLFGSCGGPKPNVYRTAYPDGTLRWKVERVGTLPHGNSETRHPNGKIAARGHYRRGLMDGLFIYYDKMGKPTRQAVYESGKLVWESHDMSAVPPTLGRSPDEDPHSIAPFPAAHGWLSAGVGTASSIPLYVRGMEDETRPDAPLLRSFTAGVWMRSAALYGVLEYAAASHQSQTFVGLGAAYAPLSPSSRWLAYFGAEGGGHRIDGIGDTGSWSDPGAQTWLPYFGVRGGVALRIWWRIAGGVDAFAKQDVDLTSRWPTGYGGTRWEVGGRVFGAILVLRWSPGLGPGGKDR